MEVRRFTARCDAQIASIERADTLREVARLATSMPLPYAISAEYSARDALRMVQTRAEDRARELIQEQIQNFVRAEDNLREKQKRSMFDSWANLTGPLGPLRTWAQSKLAVAEQQIG
jgi:hypothetical protein